MPTSMGDKLDLSTAAYQTKSQTYSFDRISRNITIAMQPTRAFTDYANLGNERLLEIDAKRFCLTRGSRPVDSFVSMLEGLSSDFGNRFDDAHAKFECATFGRYHPLFYRFDLRTKFKSNEKGIAPLLEKSLMVALGHLYPCDPFVTQGIVPKSIFDACVQQFLAESHDIESIQVAVEDAVSERCRVSHRRAPTYESVMRMVACLHPIRFLLSDLARASLFQVYLCVLKLRMTGRKSVRIPFMSDSSADSIWWGYQNSIPYTLPDAYMEDVLQICNTLLPTVSGIGGNAVSQTNVVDLVFRFGF